MNTLSFIDVQKLLKDIRKTIVHFIVHTQLLLLVFFLHSFQPRSFFAIQYAYLFIVQVFAFDVAVAIFVPLLKLVLPPRAAHTYTYIHAWGCMRESVLMIDFSAFYQIKSHWLKLYSHDLCEQSKKSVTQKEKTTTTKNRWNNSHSNSAYSLLSSLAPAHELNMDISNKSYMLIFLEINRNNYNKSSREGARERNQCIV